MHRVGALNLLSSLGLNTVIWNIYKLCSDFLKKLVTEKKGLNEYIREQKPTINAKDEYRSRELTIKL